MKASSRLQSASDGSAWQEYVLTDKGRALQTVLVALSQWADDYLFDPDEPATRLIDRQAAPAPRRSWSCRRQMAVSWPRRTSPSLSLLND